MAKAVNWTLGDLASSLISTWANSKEPGVKQSWSERPVDAGEIVAGLKKLQSGRLLDIDLINGIADVDIRLKLALTAIKAFQRLGGGDVIPNGVLGRITRGRLAKFFGCDEERRSSDPLKGEAIAAFKSNTSKTTNRKEFLLIYHVDPTVASKVISGRTCKELIAKARFAWIKHLNLVMRSTNDASEANIVMIWHNFDGPGGTLGDAHIGGKTTGQQLRLRFDENETWTETMFLNTAMHELGHILGLTHSSAPDLLMSPFQNDRTAPTEQDLARMKEIWGSA